MSLRGTCKLRTICEVLREIQDYAVRLRGPYLRHGQEIVKRLIEAEAMGKRMAGKLYEYNKQFDRGWWEKNADYEADLRRRLL